MRKISAVLLILIVIFANKTQIAKADTIVLNNGVTVNGKIEYILAGFIGIKTKDGNKKIFRQVSKGKARDIVKIGFIKKKKVSGEIFYLDSYTLEITTASGNLEINRMWVRDITLSQ
ncbi:MAG: hypothetical protein V2B14_01535 [bacterium]